MKLSSARGMSKARLYFATLGVAAMVVGTFSFGPTAFAKQLKQSASPLDTIANCQGTNWQSVANAHWYGGTVGFETDMQNIGDFVASQNPSAYGYMNTYVNNSTDMNYLGAIACRESDFNMGAVAGQYVGMYQEAPADWQGFFGTGCTSSLYISTSGCDGYNEWQTQMISALYYGHQHYGGNFATAWNNEVCCNYW